MSYIIRWKKGDQSVTMELASEEGDNLYIIESMFLKLPTRGLRDAEDEDE